MNQCVTDERFQEVKDQWWHSISGKDTFEAIEEIQKEENPVLRLAAFLGAEMGTNLSHVQRGETFSFLGDALYASINRCMKLPKGLKSWPTPKDYGYALMNANNRGVCLMQNGQKILVDNEFIGKELVKIAGTAQQDDIMDICGVLKVPATWGNSPKYQKLNRLVGIVKGNDATLKISAQTMCHFLKECKIANVSITAE